MAHSYSTRRANFPLDKSDVIDLWRANLGDPERWTAKFEWFYENSPAGEPLAVLLSCAQPEAATDFELIGVAAAGPRAFVIGDEPVTSGVLVDMAVSARHRTLFPALTLQKAVLQSGLAVFPLLYGYPNPKAAPVFQRAGYRKLGVIVRYARVLRSARYLAKRLPAPVAAIAGSVGDLFLGMRTGWARWRSRDLELHWQGIPSVRVESATATTPAGIELIRGTRGASFVVWRFADTGSRRFYFVSISRRADGSQLGWWIVEPVGDVLHVRDSSASLLGRQNVHDAWIRLASAARIRGFSSISFECLGPALFRETLRQAQMVPRSERPIFGAVREDYEKKVQSAEWFLTAADEDE